MSYENGTVNNIEELMLAIRRFACGYQTIGTVGYTGTGTGTLETPSSTSSSVAETWTITNTTGASAPTTRTHGTNMDAESGDMTGWTVLKGAWSTSAIDPQAGTYKFISTGAGVDGLWQSFQQIDLVADSVSATDIDESAVVADLGFWLDTLVTSERFGRVQLIFRNASQVQIGDPFTTVYKDPVADWEFFNHRVLVPPLTRYIDIVIDAESVSTYLDSMVLKTDSYPARWSVVGSVTGNIGNCSTHDQRQYLSHVNFLLDDPSFTFIATDFFTIPMTVGQVTTDGVEWEEKEYTTRNFDADTSVVYGQGLEKLMLRGKGAAGADNIFVGLKHTETFAGDHYIELGGYLSYNASAGFHNQVGAMDDMDDFSAPAIAVHDSTMEYWFMVNGRRLLMVIKVGTIYEHIYLGFLKQFYTPGQWPYPIFIGGSTVLDANKSSTDLWHAAYWNPNRVTHATSGFEVTSSRLRSLEGSWLQMSNTTDFLGALELEPTWEHTIAPWWRGEMHAVAENLDGTYSLFPSLLSSDDEAGATNIFGEFDGVFGISSRGIISEDTITIGGDTYMCFHSTFQTDNNNMCAVKLA